MEISTQSQLILTIYHHELFLIDIQINVEFTTPTRENYIALATMTEFLHTF